MSVSFTLFKYCIGDGHGSNGKTISKYLIDKLPSILKLYLKKDIPISEAFTKAIKKVDCDIESAGVDSVNSGSTCCLALVKDKQIYFSNTGDSRALLIQFGNINNDNPIDKIIETTDHD